MNILEVKDLTISFGAARVVDGLNFEIRENEVFGIVGESGSGKTLTALSILKLAPRHCALGGTILFRGEDLLRLPEEAIRAVRGTRIAMVFQEPATSFNPVFTVGEQIVEAIFAHEPATAAQEAKKIALDYLARVHIPSPKKIFDDYPHQLSGGTKQRAMIAMALINHPDLLILDEPTTALDVTVQAKILELIEEVIEAGKVSALFISHDFGVISRMCGRVAVMRRGRIIETGVTEKVLGRPRELYTQELITSVRALG